MGNIHFLSFHLKGACPLETTKRQEMFVCAVAVVQDLGRSLVTRCLSLITPRVRILWILCACECGACAAMRSSNVTLSCKASAFDTMRTQHRPKSCTTPKKALLYPESVLSATKNSLHITAAARQVLDFRKRIHSGPTLSSLAWSCQIARILLNNDIYAERLICIYMLPPSQARICTFTCKFRCKCLHR